MTSETPWHKSTYSGNQGHCVEVAEGPTTHIRDTQHRALAELNLPAHEWSAFLTTLTR
ncbi:DUF397 domain-containing protein [Nocardiopsis alba]|uniref:DUF397 domain-containing protein n=2 Tax=Nocardiopsis alba TaxID=53437 RepID=A0ABV5DZB5_9ACTN|nr:DUF397 domain-containing protein [Nocardiopsis alba]AFR06619.1 hypothetical protein B005_0309 [Nocardiopsis alba ATCC BAA-2165]